MFAVVKTGGKQFKVQEGTILDIERIEGEAGDNITLEEVLLIASDQDIKIGQPLVKGASIIAQIVKQKRGPKLIIFKKRRRHRYSLKKGHRQELTTIKVATINA
jgi:large subunit ribosomal protein L21